MRPIEARLEKLESRLRLGTRVWLVDWVVGCEAQATAVARVEVQDGSAPVIVELSQVGEADPSPHQAVIVFLPLRDPCQRQGTPHEHPERRIEACSAALLEQLKSIAAMSDLELQHMLADLGNRQGGLHAEPQ